MCAYMWGWGGFKLSYMCFFFVVVALQFVVAFKGRISSSNKSRGG